VEVRHTHPSLQLPTLFPTSETILYIWWYPTSVFCSLPLGPIRSDVGSPRYFLGGMKAIQAVDTQVTTLFLAKATPIAVLARLRDHWFAHIMCHGILELGKPFEASFEPHRGEHLHLLDIVRSHFPDAEFAFPDCLSHCRTDQGEHRRRGAPSCCTYAILWISECRREDAGNGDIDGRDVARCFYESLF
jgi:hypothetical protein